MISSGKVKLFYYEKIQEFEMEALVRVLYGGEGGVNDGNRPLPLALRAEAVNHLCETPNTVFYASIHPFSPVHYFEGVDCDLAT